MYGLKGTLPFRLLCLGYGADTVWGEEIISHKLAACSVQENGLGSVDYVAKDGRTVVFRTCPEERGRVIMQLGVADPVLGLKAAELCVKDVAGIDINMGCPKKFSLQGGMGAALMKDVDRATQIVKILRTHLQVPISCKIRLLDSVAKTVDLARALEAAGAHAITVHARTTDEAPTDPARWADITPVVQVRACLPDNGCVQSVHIPVLANGDLYTKKDIDQVKAITGCSGVMLARPALYNASIFRKDDNLLPLHEVIADYLRTSIRWENVAANTKYTIMEMMSRGRHPHHLRASLPVSLPPGKALKGFSNCRNFEDMCRYWEVDVTTGTEASPSPGPSGLSMDRCDKGQDSSSSSITAASTCAADGRVYSDAYFLDREEDTPPPLKSMRAEKRKRGSSISSQLGECERAVDTEAPDDGGAEDIR